MSSYIDTSAIIAILDADDVQHSRASAAWTHLVNRGEEVVISSYAVVETVALLQSRYSTEVVRIFVERMLPLLRVSWVDADLHATANALFLGSLSKSGPSLVDCSAFEIIRRESITQVFAYDRHFSERGFALVE